MSGLRQDIRTSSGINDPSCPNCQSAGRRESCDHCYVCGSSDQWAHGCRKRNGGSEKVSPGNRRGQEVAPPKDSVSKSQKYVNCQKVAVTGQVFKQCSGCNAVQSNLDYPDSVGLG